jgi:hypothetical protein
MKYSANDIGQALNISVVDQATLACVWDLETAQANGTTVERKDTGRRLSDARYNLGFEAFKKLELKNMRFITPGKTYIENDDTGTPCGALYKCTKVDNFEYVLECVEFDCEGQEKRFSIYHDDSYFKRLFTLNPETLESKICQ